MNLSPRTTVGVLVLTLCLPLTVAAAVMSSSNYKIQSDSINFGGGSSASTNYLGQDTLGEIGTGDSASANYRLHAGYQQMQESFISLSVTGNPNLGNMGGISGGSTIGSTTWTVITDSASGYQMTTQAATSPALQGTLGAYFADYAPAGAPTPDYTMNVGSGQSAFGFSPEGTDIIAKYRDNGSACNTGSSDNADRCWDGFSTSPKVISQGSGATLTGTDTVLKFQAKVGSDKIQDAQSYSASITVTAVTL